MTFKEHCAKFNIMIFGVYIIARPVNRAHLNGPYFQFMWHARNEKGILVPQKSAIYRYDYPESIDEALDHLVISQCRASRNETWPDFYYSSENL